MNALHHSAAIPFIDHGLIWVSGALMAWTLAHAHAQTHQGIKIHSVAQSRIISFYQPPGFPFFLSIILSFSILTHLPQSQPAIRYASQKPGTVTQQATRTVLNDNFYEKTSECNFCNMSLHARLRSSTHSLTSGSTCAKPSALIWVPIITSGCPLPLRPRAHSPVHCNTRDSQTQKSCSCGFLWLMSRCLFLLTVKRQNKISTKKAKGRENDWVGQKHRWGKWGFQLNKRTIPKQWKLMHHII